MTQTLTSNLQGNIIDLCPVGALTSKPYAFTARPWELTKTNTIDTMDALGANIRIDGKDGQVMRILPIDRDEINEEWISDKTRFIWDGMRLQRLDQPYIRENGRLRPTSWPEALAFAAKAVGDKPINGIVGDLASVESAFALRQLCEKTGGEVESRQYGEAFTAENMASFIGSAAITDIDKAEHIIMVGCDPVVESPVLNARIRRAWLRGCRISVIGRSVDMTYDYDYYGDGQKGLEFLAGKVKKNENTLVVIGMSSAFSGGSALETALNMANNLEAKTLYLHTAAARVGALMVGCVSKKGIAEILQSTKAIYNLGADEISIPQGAFVIYQGSHGDRGAHRADVIFPSACYSEEDGLFANLEGRIQQALRVVHPVGEAKENFAIIRAFSELVGHTLAFDNRKQLIELLYETCPYVPALDQRVEIEQKEFTADKSAKALKSFVPVIADFYLSNPIARASVLMAKLSAQNKAKSKQMA